MTFIRKAAVIFALVQGLGITSGLAANDGSGDARCRPTNGRPVSVLDCGAVGDDRTDDGPAFNRAIRAAGHDGSIYVPNAGKEYRINTMVAFTDGVGYIADSAELDCTLNGSCISIANSSAIGVSYRNLRIVSGARNSGSSFVGLSIQNEIGSTNFENLVVYPQATNGVCLQISKSFNVHFSGLTHIRDCRQLINSTLDDSHFGVNLITFDQVLWVMDKGYAPAAALVSICAGNSWSIQGGDLLNSSGMPVGIDIGDCSPTSADPASYGHVIRNLQFEGNFGNAIQIGHGRYPGATQYPRAIMIENPVPTSSGITGDFINAAYLQYGTFIFNLPPTLTKSHYRVKADRNSDGINIFDSSYVDTSYDLQSARTSRFGMGQEMVNSLQILNSGGFALQNQKNGAGSSAASLSNAPHACPAPFWIPVSLNGSTFYIPACR